MRDRYDYVVFISRLQPPHQAHIDIIRKALDIAKHKVLIVLGSHGAAPNLRNPWTADHRAEMTGNCFELDECEKLEFIPVRDHHYNDEIWLAEVQRKIRHAIQVPDATVACIGHRKDTTSYYLDLFPQWEFIDSGLFVRSALAATKVRESYFGGTDEWREFVDRRVALWLDRYRKTPQYAALAAEHRYLVDYKAKWAGAPFAPTFVTVDAVVTKAGHVLLVRRGHNPGKGLLALPGGFLQPDERLEYGAMRELQEETKIMIPFRDLRRYVVGARAFDYPERSLRGRTITHAFHFKLPDGGELPTVVGSDDASDAFWMPLGELRLHENEFNEDHLHIIEHFVTRY